MRGYFERGFEMHLRYWFLDVRAILICFVGFIAKLRCYDWCFYKWRMEILLSITLFCRLRHGQRIEIPKKEHFPLNVITRARRNLIISELSRHVYFLKSKVYQPWSAITLKQKPHYWVIELHGYVEVLSCMKSDNSVIRFCCTVIADHGWYTFDLSNRN